jgi:predicted ArsR family transcriptional regulator
MISELPLAKRGDPVSSYIAGEECLLSGRMGTQRQRVLRTLRKHGPATGAELGVIMSDDRYAAHRRLAELERMGLAERAGFRKCRVTRQKCQVWRAVKIEKDLFGNEIRKDLT